MERVKRRGTIRYLVDLLPPDRLLCPFNRNMTAFILYQTLLSRVRWQDSTQPCLQGVMLKRGQCVVGERELAERWGLSRSAVHRAIKFLQKIGKIEPQGGPLGTVITICNYDEITGNENETGPLPGQRPDSARTAPGHKLSYLTDKHSNRAPLAGSPMVPLKETLRKRSDP